MTASQFSLRPRPGFWFATALLFSTILMAPQASQGAGEPPEFINAVETAKQYLARAYTAKEIPDDGRMTIAALALVKTNTPSDNPLITNAVRLIHAKTAEDKYKANELQKDVYEAGVDLMLLESLDHEGTQYKKQMEILVSYLASRQGGDGSWDYGGGKDRDAGDTSMSQYAILGLWSAQKAGVPVNPQIWDKAAQWHINTQFSDGGFAYHPSRRTPATHTMTVAGVCNLLIIRKHLYPEAKGKWATQAVEKKEEEDGPKKKFGVLKSAAAEGQELAEAEVEEAEEEISDIEKSEREKAIEAIRDYKAMTPLSAIDRSISAAMGWLNRRFTISRVGLFNIYYLYALERVAALGSLKQIAGHDWYMEGGARLLKLQDKADGFWNEAHTGQPAATAFGILFLSKATAQSLGKASGFGLGAGMLTGSRGLKNPNDKSEEESELERKKNEKKKEPVAELLKQLMNPEAGEIPELTGALVDKVNFDDREALIEQKDILLRMAEDPRMEVKKVSMWALGRTEDYAVLPTLIEGLRVENVDVNVEALLSLCFMTRQPNGLSDQDVSPDQLIDPTVQGDERLKAVEKWRQETYRRWKKWYFTVRPYEERNDIEEALRLK